MSLNETEIRRADGRITLVIREKSGKSGVLFCRALIDDYGNRELRLRERLAWSNVSGI